MRTLFQTIRSRLTAGEHLVLVTVTAASGATPRGAGASMLVGAEGRLCGTIGGGAVEHRAEQIALQVLQEQTSRGHAFSLTRGDVENLGMICGGDVRVHFQYLSCENETLLPMTDRVEQAFAAGTDLWMVLDFAAGTLTTADRSCAELAPCLTRQPLRVQTDKLDLYTEQISSAGRVYVFGGGHVAQELVPVLSHVGFRCVVMDDRPEFADPALFPTADSVVLGDFHRISDHLTIGSEDYVCVMTRGHACDTAVQAQVLRCRPHYCGVIGSAAKAAAVRHALQTEYGLQEEDLSRITTPIGLKIKGKTPAEIAISIAAQLILVRSERNEQ